MQGTSLNILSKNKPKTWKDYLLPVKHIDMLCLNSTISFPNCNSPSSDRVDKIKCHIFGCVEMTLYLSISYWTRYDW